MQNADLKARTRNEPARVEPRAGTASKTARRLVLAGVFIALSGLASPAPTRADGGLETQKGGLFHRKGWIHPEIYKRLDDPSKPSAEKSAPASARTATAPRSTAASRARPPSLARTAPPRIPRNVVRRREQTIKRSARAPKPAPATSTTRVASLTTTAPPSAASPASPSVTGGGRRIHWVASSSCLTPRLRAAIAHVAANYGRVRVSSTCRSRNRNRRVGGARNSYHLTGQAADFRVFGNLRGAARYLRSLAGGYKHYGGGLFHIDTGPKRSW